MNKKKDRERRMDPRTGIMLLIFSNIVAFFQADAYIQIGYFCFIAILYMGYGCEQILIKWLLVVGFILLLQYKILPIMPEILSTGFYILTNYSIQTLPCLMTGMLLIKKVSLHQFVTGLRSFHLPQNLIIAISVTLRYFPAIKEEISYHLDAARLKNISKTKRIEAVFVPLMISATETASELSAAAVTRGIENPGTKTSIIKLKAGPLDWMSMVCATGFVIMTLVIR